MRLKGVLAIRHVLLFVLVSFLASCARVELPLVDGSVKSLGDYKGEWLFINYWAIWCKPCIEEIPELNALAKEEKVTVLGFNFDQKSGDELDREVKKLNIQFPLLATDPAAFFEQKKPSALPATMLIGPDGSFKRWLMGPQTQESLKAEIN